jgi:flagellar hook protein FlgE
MSFYTSLSGLQSAQTDMSTISHNLANVSTNGFKKSRAEFADVIASNFYTAPNLQVGSGSVVKSIRQQFGEGNLNQTGGTLDIAISGDGFFATKPTMDGAAVNFTRNGSFGVDNDRYVVDSRGGYLQVYPVDGSGTVVASGLDSTVNLRLPQTSGTPKATGTVALTANLYSGSEVKTAAFDRFDPTTYNQSTTSTIYDASGNPQTLTNYFVRNSAPDATNTGSSWSVYSFVGDTQLGADAANPQPVQLTFDANGAMTAPTAATSFAPFTPAGASAPQAIALSFGTGTVQTASPFTIANRKQDGAAVGQLQGVDVSDDGMVVASFSNGDTKALGKIALANFNNTSGLRQLGDGYWASTGLSGPPEAGQAGQGGMGSLMSGVIEGSNVDITEELVNLIAAQRNFQANAKALDTESQLSQTIFNIRS